VRLCHTGRALQRVPAFLASLLPALFLPAATYPPAIAFWCSATHVEASPVNDPAPAAALLCAGRYADASTTFGKIVPYWRAHTAQARYWLDTARGYFVSLLMAGRANDAQRFLASIGAGDQHLSKGDKLFIAGDLKRAFAWFAANADGDDGPRPEPVDAPITDAAAAMQSGNVEAALAALQRPSHASGPSSNGSQQALMLGDLFASRRQWSDAFGAWAVAANAGHAVPEYDYFDPYNLSALEMLYYFRGHLPGR